MESNLAIIIAILGSVIALIGVVISMMFWVRGESNALREEARQDRKDLLQISRNIENEIRDFHYRLLDIEREKLNG
jgi:flagellar basal body-associated protein FliL